MLWGVCCSPERRVLTGASAENIPAGFGTRADLAGERFELDGAV